MTPEQFRELHAANPEKCHPDCLGFVPDVGSGETQRCDDCWAHYPKDQRPSDTDAGALPEAQALLASFACDHYPP